MPRHVFLLTDGDVSQPQQVLDLIARYSKWHRLHAIGVGNGASRYLIEQSSKIGRGKHLFVDDSADV
jgi:Ca-activated chloride channel family protein